MSSDSFLAGYGVTWQYRLSEPLDGVLRSIGKGYALLVTQHGSAIIVAYEAPAEVPENGRGFLASTEA